MRAALAAHWSADKFHARPLSRPPGRAGSEALQQARAIVCGSQPGSPDIDEEVAQN
jgi:hypothetical protein